MGTFFPKMESFFQKMGTQREAFDLRESLPSATERRNLLVGLENEAVVWFFPPRTVAVLWFSGWAPYSVSLSSFFALLFAIPATPHRSSLTETAGTKTTYAAKIVILGTSPPRDSHPPPLLEILPFHRERRRRRRRRRWRRPGRHRGPSCVHSGHSFLPAIDSHSHTHTPARRGADPGGPRPLRSVPVWPDRVGVEEKETDWRRLARSISPSFAADWQPDLAAFPSESRWRGRLGEGEGEIAGQAEQGNRLTSFLDCAMRAFVSGTVR